MSRYRVEVPMHGFVVFYLDAETDAEAIYDALDILDYDGWTSAADEIKGETNHDLRDWIIEELR